MRAIFGVIILALATSFATIGHAQSLFAPQDTAPAQATDQEAAQLLADILRDDAAREALIRRLEAAAAEADTGAPAAEDEAAPQQPSIARQIAESTREIAEGAMAFAGGVTSSVGDLIDVISGERPVNWADLQAAIVALALVAIVTLALFLALRAIGQRIFRAMSDRANGGGWIIALARLVGSSVIDALIIVLAWAGGYAFALAVGDAGSMDFRQSLFLNAFLLIEMTKVVLRAIFSPRFGRLRFAPMSDESAAYWYFWSSRLVSLFGYGILLVVPVVNATISFAVGRSLTMLIVVTVLLIAILIILQNRDPIRRALSAWHERAPENVLGRVLATLGAGWHWLAIAYLIALFLAWAAHPGDALRFMLVATLRSVTSVVIGIAAMVLISRAISGGMRIPQDLRRTLPLLEARLNAFVPSILKVIRALIILAVLLSIAQAWQALDFAGWVASEVGRDTLSSLLSAALVVVVALVLWLAMSSLVEYRLNPNVGTLPTARERTLLALFRNAFMIILVIIASMLALSELGVNIAPLLAGAGVIGLAVGFGAQKLVQDIITGAFIQFENAMNEGDVVTLAGTTGVVERLTIRSVGLRDVSGTYHLIPFSSVDMVSNFMKGFAYHLAEVGVAYRENVTEVKELMHVAFDRLKETEIGAHLLEPLDMQGVTQLGDSAVVVRGRLKTTPGMQWAVGRAYNEIIKEVLDEAGVEIPFPHMTLYMGQDKDGSAPPLYLRRLDAPADTGEPAAPEHHAKALPRSESYSADPQSEAPPSHDEADNN